MNIECPPTKIIFIRHAHSYANLKKLPTAKARQALITDKGIKQVKRLSSGILSYDSCGVLESSRCYVSEFARSQNTAKCLVDNLKLPLPIQVDARLNELELSRRSIRSLMKLAKRKGVNQAFNLRTKNKNLKEHLDEAMSFVSDIRQNPGRDTNILIVGHALKGILLRIALLGEDKEKFFSYLNMRPKHCSLTLFEYSQATGDYTVRTD